MKRRLVAVMAVLVLAAGARAEEAAKPEKPAAAEKAAIQASDKAALDAAKEKEANVAGTVSDAAWNAKGTVMIIRFEGTDDSEFTAVVFKRERDAFDKAFDGDAAKSLTGKKVTVSGKIRTYHDRPEIILNKPSQLVVEEKGKADEKPAEEKK